MAKRRRLTASVPIKVSRDGTMRRTVGRQAPPIVALQVLPFLIMAVVAASDLLAGPHVELLPLLSLGPAFAALSRGLPYTLSTGACAFALAGLDFALEGLHGRQIVITCATVGGVTLASLLATLGRQRREQELADVRAVATVAQRVLLRPVPRDLAPVGLAVRYLSASRRAEIGGDVYEVAPSASGLRLLIGDVQGKGLPAVQTAAVVLGAFRERAYECGDLAAVAARLEASLHRQLADEEFVSAVLAQFSRDGSTLDLLNCGHPAPLLIPAAGPARFLEPADASLPLGLATLAEVPRVPDTVTFGRGDRVLFYTDGVSEARNAAGEYYPLARAVEVIPTGDPQAGLRLLHEDVQRYVGHPLADDAALLLATRIG